MRLGNKGQREDELEAGEGGVGRDSSLTAPRG